MVLGLLVHVTPSSFFSRVLRNEALVYKSYFFQNSDLRLPTGQDGVENRDKVYSNRVIEDRDRSLVP